MTQTTKKTAMMRATNSTTIDLASLGVIIPEEWAIRVLGGEYVVQFVPTEVDEFKTPTLTAALAYINNRGQELYCYRLMTHVPPKATLEAIYATHMEAERVEGPVPSPESDDGGPSGTPVH